MMYYTSYCHNYRWFILTNCIINDVYKLKAYSIPSVVYFYMALSNHFFNSGLNFFALKVFLKRNTKRIKISKVIKVLFYHIKNRFMIKKILYFSYSLNIGFNYL